MNLLKIYSRSWRLRCVACGQGRMFRDWFRMQPACDHCGFPFQREPGFYLGSIYINYGVTALTMTMVWFAGIAAGYNTRPWLWPSALFCVVFPLWFFRYARSLWLGFDYYWDPQADSNRQTTQPTGGPPSTDNAAAGSPR